MRRWRLRTRILAAQLIVIAVGIGTLLATVGLVAPGAFDEAMGHRTDPAGGMGGMMTELVRSAFSDALGRALLVAGTAAVVAAILVSLLVASRVARPLAHLAAATRRIAAGVYAEQVEVPAQDEIGELAASFNQMAASLEAIERRRLELVGDVAHELRTPLTTLDGYLEGLQDGVVQPDAATWTLLRGETARLARLVDDLMELWRAEAGQLPLEVGPVEIGPVLERIVARAAPGAAGRQVRLRVEAPAGLPRASADAGRLTQVLDNLVGNALRYAPEGTDVVLSAFSGADHVRIAVSDRGPGLSEEQRARVFERFYRVDPSRSRALGGAGIGLAIARALVQAMGGSIAVESPGLGQGATFEVRLPTA